MNQPIRRTPQNLKYCCANQVPPQLAISHDGSRSHTPQVSSHNLLVQLTNVTHTQSLGAQKYTRSNSKTRYTSSEFSGDLQPPPQPDVKYATETSRWESMCRSHDRVMTTCHTGAEIGWWSAKDDQRRNWGNWCSISTGKGLCMHGKKKKTNNIALDHVMFLGNFAFLRAHNKPFCWFFGVFFLQKKRKTTLLRLLAGWILIFGMVKSGCLVFQILEWFWRIKSDPSDSYLRVAYPPANKASTGKEKFVSPTNY